MTTLKHLPAYREAEVEEGREGSRESEKGRGLGRFVLESNE